MNIIVDLHSHSPYAGASGKVNFPRLRYVMKAKGIDVYGSGDILLEKWENELDNEFSYDKKRGMWNLEGGNAWLMPQTEVIVTLPYIHNPTKRKLFHMVILFRHKSFIPEARKMFLKAGCKLGIGRPFVKFDDSNSMCIFFATLKEKCRCLLIPAHIVTPDGILGGKNPVSRIEDVFGSYTSLLDGLESGLSADPAMLAGISASLGLPVISSSDAHSAAFNRLGREFTELAVEDVSAEAIAESVQRGQVVKTAEFPPFEGRYYLTGHRGDRPGHNGEELFFEENPPPLCPLCGKPFTLGVKELTASLYQDVVTGKVSLPKSRSTANSSSKKKSCQDFVYQIPLIEVIAESLKCGINTAKAESVYLEIIRQAGRESAIWLEKDMLSLKGIPEKVLEGIEKIKTENYSVEYGFDGKYGKIIF